MFVVTAVAPIIAISTMHMLGDHIDIRIMKRLSHIAHMALLAVVVSALVFMSGKQTADAADLTQRSVAITTSAASAIVENLFTFNYTSPVSIGSLAFEYCSNSPLPAVPCTPPPGLDVSAAALASESGETGYAVHPNTTVNRVVLGRVASVVTPGTSSYRLSNLTNPSGVGVVYVRLAAYSSNDGTGSAVDAGSVGFGIVNKLAVNAYVPPYLTFCVAITVAGDCTSSVGDVVNLGNLSTSTEKTATTQFAGATNDPAGYSVYVVGNTMTAGNQVIPALAVPQGSVVGTSQFGINVRQNTAPSVGADPIGVGTLAPQGGYSTPNQFKFATGDLIAQSPLTTDFNTFTVSYLVNISPAQAPGIYATTLSYIAIAAF